ncbi:MULTISPECIES: hypothetical protein [Nocardiopsis]|uniref:DUF5642 domain-containing protein n=1 Tax=Nocardiopsis sinuspersici TaxID=501010 RepID=A0A1V3C2Y3_9ACTN|nr:MULTISPECIES: hypothetical protein [Nocardiopsis]OOC54876.1 hypothetical protein NOSIN_14600 [Nocardiopsis sinuspersici]
MAPLYRYGALPLLAALVLTTACDPQLELRGSERLDALLLPPEAYPDGFTVEEIDIEDFDGASATGDLGNVEPAECGAALGGGPEQLPEEAVEGAGQTATRPGSSSGSAVVYSYVLVSGDFGDVSADEAGFEQMLDSCSRMTVANEGTEFEGTLSSANSSALPEGGGMFVMTLSGEGMEMVARTAWGQVEDMYFVLMALDLGGSSDLSPMELVEACRDDSRPDCYDSHRAEVAAEADERMAEDFEAVLERAVEKLERSA